MLLTEPFWIQMEHPGRLGIMPRPRGGEWLEDEIKGLKDAGVNVVVCLLEPHEIGKLELADEARLCTENGLVYLGFPIPDRGVPSDAAALKKLASDVAVCLGKGQSVVIHCRAGIGRSSLAAACIMLVLGMTSVNAITAIAKARGLIVPDTAIQTAWIRDFESGNRSWPQWSGKH